MTPLLRSLLSAVTALTLSALLLPTLRAAPEPARTSKVKLTFVDWEKFTDIVIDGSTSKSGSDLIYSELHRHLVSLAKDRIASGQTLVITMRDIDLAGTVEPWRGPDFGRVRYLRDTHPPRLVFDYQLLDESGAVVQEGTEKLSNLTFRYQIHTGERDTTYYEKQLLADWMRDTFRKLAKARSKP